MLVAVVLYKVPVVTGLCGRCKGSYTLFSKRSVKLLANSRIKKILMKTKSLNENELKEKIFQIYKEEEIKIFEQKWNSLSSDDKKFVLEFLKVLHPEKSKLLKPMTLE